MAELTIPDCPNCNTPLQLNDMILTDKDHVIAACNNCTYYTSILIAV